MRDGKEHFKQLYPVVSHGGGRRHDCRLRRYIATASGERYDMNDLTAAHRTLPFNTRVKVTNLSNGKSVVVRINDRGPFKKNRIIDLSLAAAKKIDLIGPGSAKVRLDIVR